MLELTVDALMPRFPRFRAGVLVATHLTIRPERGPALARYITEVEDTCASDLAGLQLGDVPEARVWREAYKAFGVKKTSYRSSVERLLKRVAQGEGIPRINALVDAYNTISVAYRMPVGADDLDRVVSPLAFRFAAPGDTFFALGVDDTFPDPPERGEVVYADAAKVLCRRWNWKQDTRSAIAAETTSAVLTVQALTPESGERIPAALEALALIVEHECGARCVWGIADASSPTVKLAL